MDSFPPSEPSYNSNPLDLSLPYLAIEKDFNERIEIFMAQSKDLAQLWKSTGHL
jgi:hypothetical protein